MCDTIVALGNSTKDGSVIFGKNSDREPNEAHEVVIIRRAFHEPDSKVKCTYIEIPQVHETYQVILAKPFWIWGAEMGSNEFGVTIGNEAVFTRTPYQKKPGLIGMDLLRLALERSKTATEALEIIIDLLKKHGQGGNCGFAHPLYYHNSFLIADFDIAWVLETSGKEWAAEKVMDVRSISNGITMGKKWDRVSDNLVKEAISHGWCKDSEEFDFSRCYSEPIYTTFSDSRRRQSCTTNALQAKIGHISAVDVINVLRSHHDDSNPDWSPGHGMLGADVCMHAGWGPIRGSQTTGSLVTVLKKGNEPLHFVTGTSAPCTSIFKPVWLDAGLPASGDSPTGKFDERALFWQHEIIHRAVLKDYPNRISLIKQDIIHAEAETMKQVELVNNSEKSERRKITDAAFENEACLLKDWKQKMREAPLHHKNGLMYQIAWDRFNKESEMGI